LIAQNLTASASKDTEVRKDSALAKNKPAETQAASLTPTGIPFIDAMLSGSGPAAA
jgi:hypothetical protein